FGTCAIRRVGDGNAHLLPNVREVARVVVDRIDEDLGIAHNHDTARILAAANPGGGGPVRVRGRLADLHESGLDEVDGDHFAAHAADDDPVADLKCLAAQNDEVAG